MAKKTFSKNDNFGNWMLIKNLASGGNSSVWLVENIETNEQQVIKILKKTHSTAKQRFIDEIRIISENQDIEGVMKILDHAATNGEDLWYVMPQTQTLNEYLADKPSVTKIEAILSIGKILSLLHARGVSHRDLKPQNLFFHGRYIIGDFGLVDYPDKEPGLTIVGNMLGPRWTIAPEMRNNPEKSNGLSADVYSLAKTLWIILTGIEKGFEGQYSPSGSIGLKYHIRDVHLKLLDDLLVMCTENDPNLRPNIEKFIDLLSQWMEVQRQFFKRNALDWEIVQYRLFPLSFPEYAEWTDIHNIYNILKIISGIESLNHMFFDAGGGGGLDLEGVSMTREDGFLELDCGLLYVVKPKRLSFCSFGSNLEWNYFYLELECISPIYPSAPEVEELVEIEPGVYKPSDYIRYYYDKYYDGYTERPEDYRIIFRVTRGNFVIFRKTSSYNLTPDHYDGRHGIMGLEKFREYIRKLVNIGYRAYFITDEEGRILSKNFTHDLKSLEGQNNTGS